MPNVRLIILIARQDDHFLVRADQWRSRCPCKIDILKYSLKSFPLAQWAPRWLLGSATPSEANLTDVQPSASATLRVSEHLAAIREAVSAIAPTDDPGVGATQLSWNNIGWGNWHAPPPKPLPQRDPHPPQRWIHP